MGILWKSQVIYAAFLNYILCSVYGKKEYLHFMLD